MPTIIVPAGVVPCQVEVPDTIKDGDVVRKCERSMVTRQVGGQRVEEPHAGALHIRPAKTMNLTADEWGVLQKARPDLAQRVIVVQTAPKAKAQPDKPKLKLGVMSEPKSEDKKPK